jgi:hypothetical protein
MDLFLHIGTEKTGTTSIQNFLYDNIDKFKEKKIHLSKLINYPNNRHLVEMFTDYSIIKKDYDIPNNFFTVKDKKIFFTRLKKNFENEIEQTKLFAEKMIITSEHFHSQLENIDQIKSLKNFLAKFFNKIKIICYFREQGELAFSWYSTLLKGGSQKDIQEYLRKKVRIDNHYFNYYDFLKKWSDVFGKENIITTIFDFNKSDNKDLKINFLNKIDPMLIISDFKNSNLRLNEAIHPLTRKYYQLFNIACSKLQKQNISKISFNESRKLIKDAIINSSKNLPIHDPDYDLKMIIYKKFYNNNVKFFSDFFYKKKNLFKLPIKQRILNQHEILENEKLILINFLSFLLKNIKLESKISQSLKKLKINSHTTELNLFSNPGLSIPDIYVLYKEEFNTELTLEIVIKLDNTVPNRGFVISKDSNKLTIKFKMDDSINEERVVKVRRLISIIKICEFTKYFQNALFFIGDAPFLGTNDNVQHVAFCSNKENTILIPDFEFVRGYFKIISELECLPKIKSQLSFFCGGMGGLKSGLDRYKLFNFAEKNNDILKIFLKNKPEVRSHLKKDNLLNFEKFFIRENFFFESKASILLKKIPLREMYFYLVQVDVDGVSNSFQGFFHKLYSGRPLLKIRSSRGYKQWYYDRLKPDYHYFDVKSDLSNFREKYYQALEEYKTTKVFPGREFISKMNYDEELQLAADKISFYFK